ncbi:kinase-like protein [Lizonia empirigonia]|nr:kinase-like protein [Lizonia empirigonia]
MIIAQNHWEENIGGHFEIANKHSSKVVALKTFKDIPNVRDMTRTTEEFKIEREILKGFRSHNMTHAMIMLDWGSITILDEAKRPISHSLIFELATFSLEDFLNSKEWARKYRKKTLLLGKLVDIVEAVGFLHEKLKTVHLDIKPANILVFEESSSRSDTTKQDQKVLLLKLSDFGLARRIGTKQRSGHDRSDTQNAWSRSSATSATRPAGVYQAPEIQETKSSHAGLGSDVWSIGCVVLMVLAFSYGGPTEVDELTRQLSVNFLVAGGREHLFYVRSDSHPWKNGDVDHHRYRYLGDFSPVTGPIPGTDGLLQAAVNPQVIAWSNVLYDQYNGDPAQPFVQQWLELIFCSVLLIDHKQRMRAAALEVIPTSMLCEAIKADNAAAVQRELDSNRDLLKQHCPGTSTFPIHCAIKRKTYDALEVLIRNADPDITNLECGGRTVLEMASEKGGDARALNQFRDFSSVFLFPEDVYKRYKKKLGSDAGRAFEELYTTTVDYLATYGYDYG